MPLDHHNEKQEQADDAFRCLLAGDQQRRHMEQLMALGLPGDARQGMRNQAPRATFFLKPGPPRSIFGHLTDAEFSAAMRCSPIEAWEGWHSAMQRAELATRPPCVVMILYEDPQQSLRGAGDAAATTATSRWSARTKRT